jgi:hypothetical protein
MFKRPIVTRTILKLVFLMALILILASCATQPEPDAFERPGFWRGYWHGLTIFFALIGHLFDSSIRIYNFPNNGGWYDFGFVLGIGTISGGGASAGRG